jgi:nitroreductase
MAGVLTRNITPIVGEAMFSQRASRRLDRDRPIGDEQLRIVLDAASKAPSGANRQPARFLLIRDRQRIAEFSELYHEAWWAKRKNEYGWMPGHDIPADSPFRMGALLASELRHAPVQLSKARHGIADSVTSTTCA